MSYDQRLHFARHRLLDLPRSPLQVPRHVNLGPPRVVDCRRERYHVYIDVGPLGNPFVVGRDGTRKDVIEKYDAWLPTQPDLLVLVTELRGLTLGCSCHPDASQGQILLRLANSPLVMKLAACGITPEDRSFLDALDKVRAREDQDDPAAAAETRDTTDTPTVADLLDEMGTEVEDMNDLFRKLGMDDDAEESESPKLRPESRINLRIAYPTLATNADRVIEDHGRAKERRPTVLDHYSPTWDAMKRHVCPLCRECL